MIVFDWIALQHKINKFCVPKGEEWQTVCQQGNDHGQTGKLLEFTWLSRCLQGCSKFDLVVGDDNWRNSNSSRANRNRDDILLLVQFLFRPLEASRKKWCWWLCTASATIWRIHLWLSQSTLTHRGRRWDRIWW